MKTTEIVFDDVSFRDRRHYRLLIDDEEEPRGITTSWSEKTTTPKFQKALVYQPDNRKKITIVVQAMVKGEVTEVDRGDAIGELFDEPEQLVCKLGIGTIKMTCTVIRQSVLDMLKMADYGQSITGVDISCGIGGQHDTIDKTQTIFYDMKVKIRDEQDTIIGSGKIGAKKSGVFLPLAPKQIENIKGGKYNLELTIGDEEPIDLPLYSGICCTSVPAAIDPANTVLLTTCVKYQSQRWAGVVHSVYTYLKRAGGEKETHLKDLKKEPLDKLLRSVIMHSQVKHEDGSVAISDDSILQSVIDFPIEDSDKISEDTSNGDFFINEVIHRHYKGHEFEIDDKSLRKHTGTVYCDAPSDISKPISLRTHFVDADYAQPSEQKTIGMNYKNIIGVAELSEQDRNVDESTQAVTVKLSGVCDMGGYNDDMKAALGKLDTELAVELIFTLIPNHKPPRPEIPLLPDTPEPVKPQIIEKVVDHREELDDLEARLAAEHEGRLAEHDAFEKEHDAYSKEHAALEDMQKRYNDEMEKLKKNLKNKSELVDKEEDEIATLQSKLKEMDKILAGGNFQLPISQNDDDGDPSDPSRERPNADGEMPGVSVLEDMVHRESIDSIYDSFHELYDEDERSVEAAKLGYPGEGFSPKAVMGHKRATKAGYALAHVIKAELTEKQKVIDRLLDEAKDRADAIDLCGVEIRKLRDDVADWKQRAQDGATELVRYEESQGEASRFIQQKVGSPEELSVMNRATLMHVALELGERVRVVEAEGAEYKQRYMEGQAARSKYHEQTKMLQDLSEAHMQQSYFIQKLQKKVAKMDTYKSTIKLQESIIGKMQKVVEAHLKTSALDAGGGGRNDLLDRLMAEIEQSEETNLAEQRFQEKVESAQGRARDAEEALTMSRKTQAAMKSEIESLQGKLSELEDTPLKDTLETLNKVSVLEAELTASQYRVTALEEQLEAQAQESGKEMSRLRTRLFDFEMAAILAEDTDNPGFDDLDAYVPNDMASAPIGSAKEAAQAINDAKKDEATDGDAAAAEGDEKIEMILTNEIKLSVPLMVTSNREEQGTVDIYYKMRYSSKAPQPLQPDTPLDILIQRIELRDYAYSPEEQGEDLRLQLDLSFDKDSWKTRTAALVANGEPLVWDYYAGLQTGSQVEGTSTAAASAAKPDDPNLVDVLASSAKRTSIALLGGAAAMVGATITPREDNADDDKTKTSSNNGANIDPDEALRREMSWTTQFSNVSAEYIMVLARRTAREEEEVQDEDELVVFAGRTKFIHSDGAEEARVKAEEDGLEPHPDADPNAPEDEHHAHTPEEPQSPRPVPTGRLRHNMHVLNSIIRIVGKTASYIDEDEADEAHFENPDHAPEKVATTTDNKTGEVVKLAGDDNSSDNSSEAGSKAGSKTGSAAGPPRGGSKAGTDAGSNFS